MTVLTLGQDRFYPVIDIYHLNTFFTVCMSLINIVFVYLKIFDEADLDDDSQLSFAEFEHVISKAPDFVK